MSAVPLLSEKQLRRISPLVPESMRDRTMITAIVYREFAGCGLRDACEVFGVSRTGLSDWTRALEADGTLGRIMNELGLKPAGRLIRRAGGAPWWKKRGPDLADRVEAFQLQRFRESLTA